MLNKAIFWDRDGVLNALLPLRSDGEKNVSPQRLEDFRIIPEAALVVQKMREKGYLNIVVTNQPDIARGKMLVEELEDMNNILRKEIAAIDAIYVCVHDDADTCDCRKPKPGMIINAAKEFSIDLGQSYVVGDSMKDIEAGNAAGCKTILLALEHNAKVGNYSFKIQKLRDLYLIIKE